MAALNSQTTHARPHGGRTDGRAAPRPPGGVRRLRRRASAPFGRGRRLAAGAAAVLACLAQAACTEDAIAGLVSAPRVYYTPVLKCGVYQYAPSSYVGTPGAVYVAVRIDSVANDGPRARGVLLRADDLFVGSEASTVRVVTFAGRFHTLTPVSVPAGRTVPVGRLFAAGWRMSDPGRARDPSVQPPLRARTGFGVTVRSSAAAAPYVATCTPTSL